MKTTLETRKVGLVVTTNIPIEPAGIPLICLTGQDDPSENGIYELRRRMTCRQHVSCWGKMTCQACQSEPMDPRDVPERCPHGLLAIDPCRACTDGPE